MLVTFRLALIIAVICLSAGIGEVLANETCETAPSLGQVGGGPEGTVYGNLTGALNDYDPQGQGCGVSAPAGDQVYKIYVGLGNSFGMDYTLQDGDGVVYIDQGHKKYRIFSPVIIREQ